MTNKMGNIYADELDLKDVTGHLDCASVSIDNTTVIINSRVMGNLTQLNVDNIQLDVNQIISTNTNGDLQLACNGTGNVPVWHH